MLKSPINLEIISIHVPKTGGTTFGNILQRVYGGNRIFLDYPWQDPVDTVERDHHLKAIHGHFSASKYQNFPAHIKRIVWIRNPIDRLISHYFYWKSLPVSHQAGDLHRYVIENNLGLLDFAKISAIRNHISQWYINIALNEFYFVGIHEFFEDDWNHLSRLLKFESFEVSSQNENKNKNYQLFKKSTEFREIILKLIDLNSEDMHLYQSALKKRYERFNG
jgi:Sulfotransferase family